LPGDCHYLEGNLKAKRRVQHIQNLLAQIGLQAERVRMYNMSSAMAAGFVSAAKEMTEQITNLGSNPLKNGG
jgi:F420-non-reducing hydrogenase iron-sulfur subunit